MNAPESRPGVVVLYTCYMPYILCGGVRAHYTTVGSTAAG